MDAPDRVFLVETATTTMRLTVPHGFKMTYGPLIQVSHAATMGQYGGHVALRIYRTEKDCVALFRDVLSFREINALSVEFLDGKTDEEKWLPDAEGEIERSIKRRNAVAAEMEGAKRPW